MKVRYLDVSAIQMFAIQIPNRQCIMTQLDILLLKYRQFFPDLRHCFNSSPPFLLKLSLVPINIPSCAFQRINLSNLLSFISAHLSNT